MGSLMILGTLLCLWCSAVSLQFITMRFSFIHPVWDLLNFLKLRIDFSFFPINLGKLSAIMSLNIAFPPWPQFSHSGILIKDHLASIPLFHIFHLFLCCFWVISSGLSSRSLILSWVYFNYYVNLFLVLLDSFSNLSHLKEFLIPSSSFFFNF